VQQGRDRTRDACRARIQAITTAMTKLGADKGKLELDSIGNPASRLLRGLRFVDTRAEAGRRGGLR
jgi:hypothetical protein